MTVFKVQCPTCRSDDPTIHRAYQCGHSDCPCTGCSWHECEDSWHDEGVVVDAPARSEFPILIYAASRASVPERPAMWQKLRAEGVHILSSWIDEAGPGATADLQELWMRIEHEIHASDALVLYVEDGDFPLKGALIEVGMAIGMGKRVYIVAPGLKFTPPSYQPIGSWIKHPLVRPAETVHAAIEFERKLRAEGL